MRRAQSEATVDVLAEHLRETDHQTVEVVGLSQLVVASRSWSHEAVDLIHLVAPVASGVQEVRWEFHQFGVASYQRSSSLDATRRLSLGDVRDSLQASGERDSPN
jgi:hypothetical protein